VDAERERTIDAGRPDFKIMNGERFFIVENKIYDRNDYHIEQYWTSKEERCKGLGLITNHALDSKTRQEADQYGVQHRTWRELKTELEQQLDKFTDGERPCVDAYLTYVHEVCDMVELQRIDLTNLESLYHFAILLREVLGALDHRGASFKYHSNLCYDCCSGYYFDLSMEGEEKNYKPWAGVYSKDKQPTIYFAFTKFLDPELYERWKGRREDRAMMEINGVDNRQETQMGLKENEFATFSKVDLEAQRQLLTEFAKAVVDEVYNARATTSSAKM
jgi:hypothetical protein